MYVEICIRRRCCLRCHTMSCYSGSNFVYVEIDTCRFLLYVEVCFLCVVGVRM